MGNGKLALIMPTFRFDETAKHCIRTIAAMGGGDVDVLIGDNSENPEKWDFLHKVAARSDNCQVFCHEKSMGGLNHSFLLGKTDNEYIAPTSDDDIFVPDYFLAGRDELRNNPACSAAGGLFLFMTWHGPRLEITMPLAHEEPTPVERIAAYTNGLNAMSYAVYRSSAMRRFDEYRVDRPFWPSYLDQLASYAMLCAGTFVIKSSRQLFLYNNVNWTPEKSLESDGRWFLGAGLPPEITHLNRLFWTADLLHFFNSTYRPGNLSEDECQKIVENLFGRLFEHEFRFHLVRNTEAIGGLFKDAPGHIQILREIITTPYWNVRAFLEHFVSIVSVFSQELAAKYAIFFDTSLLPNRPGSERRLSVA